MMRRGIVVPLFFLLLSAACADTRSVGPSGPEEDLSKPQLQTQLWCQQNPELCNSGGEGDPNPSAPGYFFGTTITPTACISPTGAGINDPDYDGLDTICEEALAYSFRPTLVSSPYDCNMGMEPYWAAKYFPVSAVAEGDDSVVVRIAYLFGYYVDCGAPADLLDQIGCDALDAIGTFFTFNGAIPNYTVGPLPIQPENICDGHIGDSEFITVDLRYSNTTQHWYTENVYFSSHWKTSGDHSRRTPTTSLEFGDQYGGHPKVYVALGKHANYPTRASCENNGGAADECAGNSVLTRVRAGSLENIGSGQVNMPNAGGCVNGGELYAYYPEDYRQECLWTSPTFAGWDLYAAGVTPYKTELAVQFECYGYRQFMVNGNPTVGCWNWGINRQVP